MSDKEAAPIHNGVSASHADAPLRLMGQGRGGQSLMSQSLEKQP